MKSLFLLLLPILCFGQSINIKSQFSLGRPMAGATFVLDEKPATFEFGIYSEPTGTIHNQIKLGLRLPHADRPTKNRVMLHVIGDANLTPGDEMKNSMTLGVGVEYTVPKKLKNGDYLIWGIGADAYSDKSKAASWPVKEGELTWSPSVSIEYSFGKRYWQKTLKPGKEKVQGFGLGWNKWNTSALLIGALVDGPARGGLEAFHADRYVFEKKGMTGRFWAHDQDLNKYNEDGTMKTQAFGNFARDFDHTAGDVSKVARYYMGFSMGVSGAVRVLRLDTDGMSKRDRRKLIWKTIGQEALKGAFVWAVSSGVERGVYNRLRY